MNWDVPRKYANTALPADARAASGDQGGCMMNVMVIVLAFAALAVLAAVPLVLLMHAADKRGHVKDVTPHDLV